VQSKKQSGISKPLKLHNYRFFIDRNLGSQQLPGRLRGAGISLIVHDDVYTPTERDPWIFYECGKKGLVVLTSDKSFMKSFPHMVAITLGRTTVLAFSNNNFNSKVRSEAFLSASSSIHNALAAHRGVPFIATIGMRGTIEINAVNPRPTRAACERADWESYLRVCRIEGIRPQLPSQLRFKGM
jgi:predicted nuclease of predicted toxin-antitoxin system